MGPAASRRASVLGRRRRRRPRARRGARGPTRPRCWPSMAAPRSEQLAGPLHADEAGQQPGAAGVGGEAPLAERLPHPGVVGEHEEVGGGGDVESDARHPPPGGDDDRHLRRAQHRDRAGVPCDGSRRWIEPMRVARRRPGRGVAADDVEAAAEVVALGRQQDAAHRLVAAGGVDLVDERRDHVVVEGVALRRLVEVEPQHAARRATHAGARSPVLPPCRDLLERALQVGGRWVGQAHRAVLARRQQHRGVPRRRRPRPAGSCTRCRGRPPVGRRRRGTCASRCPAPTGCRRRS